jgi:adenine/guanine phosphoribosyltransferase-like PRPP-binding protein
MGSVDHQGEVLETVVTGEVGRPRSVAADERSVYSAAMREPGPATTPARISLVQPHEYWQRLYPPGAFPAGLIEAGFAVELADGQLVLPVRTLADGRHGLASLIINQASFEVQDQLAADLAERLQRFEPEVVVGLPTLGLTLASAVAQKLGHARYVPFGTSRKFWYLPELSVALSSVTTPDQRKSLYVDPRMPPLLAGRRVALVDDVISSGASIRAGLALLQRIGVEPTVIGAAMLQSSRWRAALEPSLHDRIAAVFSTPMLARGEDGHWRAAVDDAAAGSTRATADPA